MAGTCALLHPPPYLSPIFAHTIIHFPFPLAILPNMQFHRAANILTRLNTVPHENVLQLRFFCEDPPALCLELCDSTLSGKGAGV